VIGWHTGGTLLDFATATANEWGLDERHARTIAIWMNDFQRKPTLGGVVLADTQVDPRPCSLVAPPAPSMERLLGATVGTLALRNPSRLGLGTDAALSAQATAGNAKGDLTGGGDAQSDQPAERGEVGGSEETDPAPTVPHREHTALAPPQLGPPPTEDTGTEQGDADDRGLNEASFLGSLPGGELRVKGAPSIFALPPADDGMWHPLVHDLAPQVLNALHGLELLFKAKRHSTGVAPWAVNMA
jgi:hypothetical protein